MSPKVQTHISKSLLTSPSGCQRAVSSIKYSKLILLNKTCTIHSLFHLNLLQFHHFSGSGRKLGSHPWPSLSLMPHTQSIRKSCWLYFQNVCGSNSLWPPPLPHQRVNFYQLSTGQLPWPLAIILEIKGVWWVSHLWLILMVQKSVQAPPKGFRKHLKHSWVLIGRKNKNESFLKHKKIYRKCLKLA